MTKEIEGLFEKAIHGLKLAHCDGDAMDRATCGKCSALAALGTLRDHVRVLEEALRRQKRGIEHLLATDSLKRYGLDARHEIELIDAALSASTTKPADPPVLPLTKFEQEEANRRAYSLLCYGPPPEGNEGREGGKCS